MNFHIIILVYISFRKAFMQALSKGARNGWAKNRRIFFWNLIAKKFYNEVPHFYKIKVVFLIKQRSDIVRKKLSFDCP